MSYTYDASRKALLTPARDAAFFAAGRPSGEAALCAEFSWLAYAPFEREPAAKALVETVLQGIGFNTCSFLSSGSTQALLAQDTGSHLTVLAFRGTELDPRDWRTDLKALLVPWPGGGHVHQGFAEALSSVWEPVLAALRDAKGRQLYTGHSLGAALATLAASRRSPDALLTFGSPRVGDAAFAQTTQNLRHERFVNCCDIVTRLPPEAFGYRHAGPVAYLDRGGVLCPALAERLIAEDQRRARIGYLLRWAWRRGTMCTRDTADHAPTNYVSAVARSTGIAPEQIGAGPRP